MDGQIMVALPEHQSRAGTESREVEAHHGAILRAMWKIKGMHTRSCGMEMSAGSIEVHTHMPAGCSMAILSVHALPPSNARPTRSSFDQLLSTHLHAQLNHQRIHTTKLSQDLPSSNKDFAKKETDKFIRKKNKLRLEIPDSMFLIVTWLHSSY